ncbi:MAG: hypothetical protein HY710_00365 [Candidatus Latescibacteria bacterium]|nr:hypothetical protein [Candidatus Latescibacterota bacterium]
MSRAHRVLFLAVILAAGCGSSRLFLPPDPPMETDTQAIPLPTARDPKLVLEILDKSFDYQIKQAFDLPRGARKAAGKPYEALNVDAFGEVSNSTWFTHRNGRAPMSLDAIRRGPSRMGGPDTSGVWTVVKGKSAGVTPGFTIMDAKGQRYLIKFDPPGYPELASGTEAVASRLCYAAGYHVPEYSVSYLRPDRLVLSPQATITMETGDKRAPISKRQMTEADLAALLKKANPTGQPRVRVGASRFLDGTDVGPWPYLGVRMDDANDFYSHEHRRELRGLYIISSWLNHADMKEENTLDMYDPEKRYLTHYLIDFGASMGSSSTTPSTPRRGQANSFDAKHSFVRLITLGLYVYGYEKAPLTLRYPSVGYLENDLFKPNRWKPMYPMPAFENLTRRDAFWGTNIVTSFTDEQIEAAVTTGAFSDPQAAAYLVKFLKERRDRIGRYWFARVNTLDRFEMLDGSTLRFTDLAVSRGYADARGTRYQVEALTPAGATLCKDTQDETTVRLDPAWNTHPHVVLSLVPQRQRYKARPVLVYLKPQPNGWRVIGVRRTD